MENKNLFIPKQNTQTFLQQKRTSIPENNNHYNDVDFIKCNQCKKATDISKTHQCSKCEKDFCESCFTDKAARVCQDCLTQDVKLISQSALSKVKSNPSMNTNKCDICKKEDVEVIKFRNHDDAFKYLKRGNLFKVEFEELENKYSNMKLKKENSICGPCLNSITSPKNGGVSNFMSILEINTVINKANTNSNMNANTNMSANANVNMNMSAGLNNKSNTLNINQMNMPIPINAINNLNGQKQIGLSSIPKKILNDHYINGINYNNSSNSSDNLKMSSVNSNVSMYDEKKRQQQHQYSSANTQNSSLNYYSHPGLIIPPLVMINPSSASINQSVPYQPNYNAYSNLYYSNHHPNMQIDNSNSNSMNNLFFSSSKQLFYHPQTQSASQGVHLQSPMSQHQPITASQIPFQSQTKSYSSLQTQLSNHQRAYQQSFLQSELQSQLQSQPQSQSYIDTKAQLVSNNELPQPIIPLQSKYQSQMQKLNRESNTSSNLSETQNDIESSLQMQINTMLSCSELQKKCLNSFHEFLQFFSKEIQEQKANNEKIEKQLISCRYDPNAIRNSYYNPMPSAPITASLINQFGTNVNNTNINFIQNPSYSTIQNNNIQDSMPGFITRSPYDGSGNAGGHMKQ